MSEQEVPLRAEQMMSTQEQEASYRGLSAESIRALERIDLHIKAITTQAAIEVGKWLSEAREIYRHQKQGGFEGWVLARFGWERTKAYRLIWCYEQLGTVANLQQFDIVLSAQYQLSAPSVPQAAREEALQRAEAGEKITLTVAKEIIEAQQAQRRAEETARVAQAEGEQAREQLAQQEEHTRAEIASLTHQLTALEKHRAELAQPNVEIREVEKMVIPPEVTAQLAQLQAQVQTITEQRENLARKAAQLGADLAAWRDTTQAARERDTHHLRIGQHWREVTDTFSRHVGTLLGHFPSLLETQAFEAEEWERLAHLEELAQRLLAACRALREAPRQVIVNADDPDENEERTPLDDI